MSYGFPKKLKKSKSKNSNWVQTKFSLLQVKVVIQAVRLGTVSIESPVKLDL